MTETQFDQLQRLTRKPRNAEVARVVKDLFLNHKLSEHERVIDALDEPFEFRRYVREARNTIYNSLRHIEAITEFERHGEPSAQLHFNLVLSLYQYEPSDVTKKQLELRVVGQVPAKTVAEITDSSVPQVSRVVSQYRKKVAMINEVKEHFSEQSL